MSQETLRLQSVDQLDDSESCLSISCKQDEMDDSPSSILREENNNNNNNNNYNFNNVDNNELKKNQFNLNERNEEEIVINPKRMEGEEEIRIPLEISKVLLPHQIEGIRFLWENIVYMKGMEGCILADSMGLGKTIQTISLLSTLLLQNRIKTALIVVPSTTISNWEIEFVKWLSSINRPLLFNFQGKTPESRIELLEEWRKKGGVLILSYELFRQLTHTSNDSECSENISEYRNFLCNPGADVIVVDEGHKISNPSSNITECLKSVKTTKRIILTGYPLQNRLGEYWCMVDFIRPHYLGTIQEFKQMFENPISNGLHSDSRHSDVRLAKRRMYVLSRLLKPFLLRRDFSCLKNSLLPKHEFVIGVRLSNFQRELYLAFLKYRENYFGPEPHSELLAAQHIFLKIFNHPDVLSNSIQKHREMHEKIRNHKLESQGSTEEEIAIGIDFSWAEELMKDFRCGELENGPKLLILLQIIHHCREQGERILVFSQSVQTLNVIQWFIEDKNSKLSSLDNQFIRYYRIDGSTAFSERQKQIDSFNSENSKTFVFLLSTKTGGLGINLTAANRVVIFDSSWNPSHDVESIYRAFRFGQKKEVYIYRLIAEGTIEARIYDRQIIKQGLFRNVIDERHTKRLVPKVHTRDLFKLDVVDSYNSSEEAIVQVRRSDTSNDPVLFNLFSRSFSQITQLHEHESFLEDDETETVDYNDKKQVDEFITKETNLSSETWRRMVMMENKQANQIRYDPNEQPLYQKKSTWLARIERTVQNMIGESDPTSIDLEDFAYYGISEDEEKHEKEEQEDEFMDPCQNVENVNSSSGLGSIGVAKLQNAGAGRKRFFSPIINKLTTTLRAKEEKEKGKELFGNETKKIKTQQTREQSKRYDTCRYFWTQKGCFKKENCIYSHEKSPNQFLGE